MLVVSDVDDVFLPKPNDLLINLTESRQSLESLLGRINDMFQDNHTVGSAMGPALQAGFKLMVSFLMERYNSPEIVFRLPSAARSWYSRLHYQISEPVRSRTVKMLKSSAHPK